MSNSFFRFKQFTVQQDACAMKVCTDACLFGAWCAAEIQTTSSRNQTLLDIGTGTGLLSLMIRQKHELEIDTIEIDAAAALQAQQNVASSPWPNSIHIQHGDVLVMELLKRYDYIVSNPPFYKNQLQSPDAKRNVAHHSSQLSLKELIHFISIHLSTDGSFFLMLHYRRKAEMLAILLQKQLYISKEVTVQQTGLHAPFRILLEGSRTQSKIESTIITITEPSKQYTPEFTALLKDYYLYL